MGKTKIKKSKKHRERPTGIPSEKEIQEEDELVCNNDFDSTVDSVIEKLLSSKSEDKECAATIIAQSSENAEFVSRLIDRNIIKIAAPLLIDANPGVRHSVCGCLRNLSSCGGHVVCDAMIDQDVMTVLVTLLKQYKSEWVPIKSTNGKIDSKKETFIEAVSLLSNLCESSSTALEIFNKNELLSILLPGLNVEVFGNEIAIVVAQCIHVVLEDNVSAIQTISDAQNSEMLFSFVNNANSDPEIIHLKALASGIITNLNSGKFDNCSSVIVNAIMNGISEILEIPVQPNLVKMAGAIANLKEEKKSKYRDEEQLQQKETDVQELLNSTKHILVAKQVTLEILTNICCNDDKNEDVDTGSSTSDDMVVDEADDDENDSMPICPMQYAPCEMRELIINKELMNKVLNQIVAVSEIVKDQILLCAEGKTCLKLLQLVKCRALLCVNNLLQGLDIDELGGNAELFKLWMNLANLVFTQTELSNIEQLEAATSSIRAVLRKLSEAKSSTQFSKLTESDLTLLIDVFSKSNELSVKVNIVQSVATIGFILSNMAQENSRKLITIIGTFLIDTCVKSNDLWLTAEGLDALFDLFAEDHLDCIAQEIALVEKLQHLQPSFRAKIKQNRNSLKEHHPVITTARMNLARFIKYKNKSV